MPVARLAHEPCPVGLRGAIGERAPASGHLERRRFLGEAVELYLVDEVLRADALGAKPARADPPPDRLGVAPDPTCGLGDGQHCRWILQHWEPVPRTRGSSCVHRTGVRDQHGSRRRAAPWGCRRHGTRACGAGAGLALGATSALGPLPFHECNSDVRRPTYSYPMVQPQLQMVADAVEAPARRTAALRYPGSKWSIASTIVHCFGRHYHYVEPYFGSGAVFFTKPPSPHELVNDSNSVVSSFFRVLRDRTEDLCWALETTPWSREEYNTSDIVTGDEVEDARRFVVRVWQAHASDLAKKTGWKTRGLTQRARGMSVRWQRVPAELTQLAWRLADAEIENRPALDVMRRFAASDCLIYADPPYLPRTRTQKMYAQEMSQDEHVEMLNVLLGHPGPVVLSGYDNDLYNESLSGWKQVAFKPPKVEKAAVRMEKLWIKR